MSGTGAFGLGSFGGLAFGVSGSTTTPVVPGAIPSGIYATSVWAAVKAALTYAQATMNPANPQASVSVAQTVANTLRNGVTALNTYQFYVSAQQSFANLSAIQALPLTLDSATETVLTNYITTLQSAASPTAAGTLLVFPLRNTAVIAQGVPLVPYPGVVEWQMAFRYAPLPAGLTVSNFAATALAFAEGFATLSAALTTQGVNYNGSSLNEVNYTHLAATISAFEVSQLVLSPAADLAAAWNLLVILPTMVRVASLLSNDPTSNASQQIAVQRYVALATLQQFNNLLVSFNNQTPQQVRLVPVLVGDSLMDIAARELGDYTQWSALATANNLLPPYISPTPGPNVAVVGQLLFVPNGSNATQLPIPNYQTFFLGTDIYYGVLGQDMNTWLGDLPIISGYQNLALSLSRRLQTTLGTLIYHATFGSRIPPEVGAIMTSQTPSQIQAYATSALLSDPRVQSVNNVVLTTNLPLGLIGVTANVIPKGPGNFSKPVQVTASIKPTG